MVKYLCITCMYVGINRSSFKIMDGIKPVLELLVPEMRNISIKGYYSLICDQCYFFLKTVEKFRMRCIESHKRICAINIDKLKEKPPPTAKPTGEPVLHPNNSAPASTLNDDSNKHTPRKSPIDQAGKTVSRAAVSDVVPKTNSNSMSSDEKQHKLRSNASSVTDHEAESVESDDDYYITREDLIAAGILPDYVGRKSTEALTQSGSANDSEMDVFADGNPASSTLKEASIKDTESPVKKRKFADDSSGTCNTQHKDKKTKCTLCLKRCNSSQEGHSNHQGKPARCDYCSFFSMEKASLLKHYDVCHQDLANCTTLLTCSKCVFKCYSTIQMSIHRLKYHANGEHLSCSIRSTANEHLGLERNYCEECVTIFLTYDNFQEHMIEKHQKLLCGCCQQLFETEKDIEKNQ